MNLGGNMITNNELVYEEFDGRLVVVQVNYDYDGIINKVFVYNDFTDGLVEVNLEAFESRHPSRYNYLQNRINNALNNTYREYL